jgi:hypothetical protein
VVAAHVHHRWQVVGADRERVLAFRDDVVHARPGLAQRRRVGPVGLGAARRRLQRAGPEREFGPPVAVADGRAPAVGEEDDHEEGGDRDTAASTAPQALHPEPGEAPESDERQIEDALGHDGADRDEEVRGREDRQPGERDQEDDVGPLPAEAQHRPPERHEPREDERPERVLPALRGPADDRNLRERVVGAEATRPQEEPELAAEHPEGGEPSGEERRLDDRVVDRGGLRRGQSGALHPHTDDEDECHHRRDREETAPLQPVPAEPQVPRDQHGQHDDAGLLAETRDQYAGDRPDRPEETPAAAGVPRGDVAGERAEDAERRQQVGAADDVRDRLGRHRVEAEEGRAGERREERPRQPEEDQVGEPDVREVQQEVDCVVAAWPVRVAEDRVVDEVG